MKEWIFPCNPAFYRLDDALWNMEEIEWHQVRNISRAKAGDSVYFYETDSQSIRWKGKLTAVKLEAVDLRCDDEAYNLDRSPWHGTYVRVKRLREYGVREDLALYNLRLHGLKSVYSYPIAVPRVLSHYLLEIDRQCERAEEAAEMTPRELRRAAKKQGRRKPEYREVLSRQYERSEAVKRNALERAGGICQLCGKAGPFLDRDGRPYLECHHIVWLSRQGPDTLENTVALCPNCHRKMHRIENPKDIEKLKKAAR